MSDTNLIQAGTAFASVAGLLGGFSITILVLLLGQSLLDNKMRKDLIAAIFLLAAGGYIFAAGFLANTTTQGQAAFSVGIRSFHLSNLALVFGLTLFTFQMKLLITRLVAILLCLGGIYVAVINLF